MRIIRSYFLREIVTIFWISLFIITVIFMSQRIIQQTEWAVNRGFGVADIAKLMLYLMPFVLLINIPMVTLFSVLLGVGRLSADNEITAIKSAGVSLFSLVKPVMTMALLSTALSLMISQALAPRAARATRILKFEVLRTRTDAGVVEKTFLELLPGTTFYVRERLRDGTLRGVMATQELRTDDRFWSMRRVLYAREGRFVHDRERLANELWLTGGAMIQEERKDSRNFFTQFELCRIRLDLGGHKPNPKDLVPEMDLVDGYYAIAEPDEKIEVPLADPARRPEMGKKYRRRVEEARLETVIQFHERLAWPLSCVALCFWALPLGIQPPRAGRARSIVVAVLLCAVFYYLMVMSRLVALKEWLDPGLAVWLPDILIFATGLHMLWRKNQEKDIFFLAWAEDNIYYIAELIRERREKNAGAGKEDH